MSRPIARYRRYAVTSHQAQLPHWRSSHPLIPFHVLSHTGSLHFLEFKEKIAIFAVTLLEKYKYKSVTFIGSQQVCSRLMLYYLSLKAAPLPRRVILEPLIDTFLQNQSAFYNILALQTLSPQYHNNNCVCRIELLTSTRRFVILIVSYVKALVIDFNQEKALVRAFSVIVKTLPMVRLQLQLLL